MNLICGAVVRTGCLYAAAFALVTGDAKAQDAQADASTEEVPEAVQEVRITGTRLRVEGYQQPTPVTVVSAERLQSDAHMDLSKAITQLPAVGSSQSPNSGFNSQSISQGTAGLSLMNLRSLGVGRTLALYDGIRVATSSPEIGGVDLNLLPSSLIERIDIVTGGASAAWGSDAVAGVINVVLNRNFRGLYTHLEGQTNEDAETYSAKAEVTFGTDLGSRGSLIVSGSYLRSPELVIPTETSWYRSQILVNNPLYTPTNDEPRLIHASNVGMSLATRAGLITGGPFPVGTTTVTNTGPLRGIQFVEGGRPVPFDFGNVSGSVSNGGTFANPVLNGQAHNLISPIDAVQLFGRVAYDLTDDVTLAFELDFGRTETRNSSPTFAPQGSSAVRIRNDNAFLDPSIAAQMPPDSFFLLGTTNSNNVDIARGDEPWALGVGNWNNDNTRTLFRQVISLEGPLSFLGDWKWNLDLQHSEVRRETIMHGNPITARYQQAVDAVRVTPQNVGDSGLPIGSIVCRSTLTDPTNGCIPLNILGLDVASPEAIRWVQGTSDGSGAWNELESEQQTASITLSGEPFSTWAGGVPLTLGVDYRKEAIHQWADPLSYQFAYTIGNVQKLDASNHSIEGFGEINIPLIRDGFVNSLEVNAAARWTDYSTSGEVTTWKIGFVTQINDPIRLRATVSRDIRAPSLVSLFSPGRSQRQVVTDPLNPGVQTNIATIISGNPTLEPEIAKTYTAGLVLTPFEGFSASVDYYSIDIEEAFLTPTVDRVIFECVAGNQQFCDLITRDPVTNLITELRVAPVNAAFEKTKGIDFQFDYRMHAFGGRLDFSLLGNYTTEHEINALGVIRRPLNSLNSTQQGAPKFRGTFGVRYSTDRFATSLQVRGIGSAKLNTLWGPKDVDDNDVPAVAFVDLRGSYNLGLDDSIQLYAAVDNLFDRDPPIIPNDPNSAFSYFFVPTRTEIYDILGRVFRVGVRAKF